MRLDTCTILYVLYKDMLAVCIGNCQMSALSAYLRKNEEFTKRYTEIKDYANWQILERPDLLPVSDLMRADLILYQPLSDVHGCLSMNKHNRSSIFQYISEETLTLSFPRIHNNALWPIVRKHRDKPIWYGAESLPKDIPLESVLSLYDAGRLDFQFASRFARNKAISVDKERDTEIKIFDYIESSIPKRRTFLTHDHPTSHVFTELYRQTCELLDLPYVKVDSYDVDENCSGLPDSIYGLPGEAFPISPYAYSWYECTYPYTNAVDAHAFYRNEIKVSRSLGKGTL